MDDRDRLPAGDRGRPAAWAWRSAPRRSSIPALSAADRFNAIPKVALVPILMIWVGVGSLPAVITAS